MSTRLGYYIKLATIGISNGKLPAEFKPEYVLELIEIAEELRDAAVSSTAFDRYLLDQAVSNFDNLDRYTTQYD